MPTVIGELSNPSTRAAAFAYLPIFNWLGAVIGPLIGGLLSSSTSDTIFAQAAKDSRFPYLIPCFHILTLLASYYRIWSSVAY
jgi:MFS family permease